VFGSVRFVHNNDPHRIKLDPSTFKSVFFGYSRTQKEYKCYCLELNHFIISVDVTFFESKPYFDIESHSFESEIFCIFLVQECSIDNIALDNTHTFPPKQEKPTKVYTKHISIAPLSSIVPVFT